MTETIEELERLLEKATPQNIDTAEIKEDGLYECPWCNGQGEVEGSTYINYDNVASNVQFSGIGPEFGHAEALFRAVIKHLPRLLSALKVSGAVAPPLPSSAGWQPMESALINLRSFIKCGAHTAEIEAHGLRLVDALEAALTSREKET